MQIPTCGYLASAAPWRVHSRKEAPAGAVVALCKRHVAHFGLDRAFPIFSNTVADLSMVFSRSSASSRVSVSKSAVSRLTAASAW